MTQHQAYVLSLSGTLTIWLGGVWMLVGGIGFVLRIVRHDSIDDRNMSDTSSLACACDAKHNQGFQIVSYWTFNPAMFSTINVYDLRSSATVHDSASGGCAGR